MVVSVFFLENCLVLIRSKILVHDPPPGWAPGPGFLCFRAVETKAATAIASAATVAAQHQQPFD